MARKRGPGGGRKLGSGEKHATLTARLRPETRLALEQATEKSRHRSLSATAEFILRTALMEPRGEPRQLGLARAVSLLANSVEKHTQKSWRDDPFTGMALRYAVEALLFHLAPTPEGPPEAPEAVKQFAAKMPDEMRERDR